LRKFLLKLLIPKSVNGTTLCILFIELADRLNARELSEMADYFTQLSDYYRRKGYDLESIK
jgi:hypothetical protein